MALVKCPGCDLKLEESDLSKQMQHMDTKHPEIVAKRRREMRRLTDYAQD